MDFNALQPGSELVAQRAPLPGHFPALDGLRGIAIAMVMCHHFTIGARASGGIAGAIIRTMEVGWAGVTLFFVLSGFLITGILLDTRGSSNYFRAFYARRTLRIFPLYYGVLAGCAIITQLVRCTGVSVPPSHGMLWLWTYTSDIPKTFSSFHYPTNPFFRFNHFWSLAIEEQFYLAWPLVVLFCRRGTLLMIALASLPVAILSRVALMRMGVAPIQVDYFIFTRTDGLCGGAMVAMLIRGPISLGELARRTRPIAGICLLCIPFLIFSRQLSHGKEDHVFKQSVLAIFFAAIVMLIVADGEGSALARVLFWRPLRLLGKYSYGVYVFHFLLMPFFDRLLPRADLGPARLPLIGDMVFLTIAAAISIAVAFISWHVYEKQFLKLKRFFAYQHPRGVAEVSALGAPPGRPQVSSMQTSVDYR